MSLDNSDTLELKDRLDYLVEKYTVLSLETAKKLEEFGKVRKELQIIVTELQSRGEEVNFDNVDEEKINEARRLKQSLSSSI